MPNLRLARRGAARPGLRVAVLASLLLASSGPGSSAAALDSLAAARTSPVTDRLFGTAIIDPYRWMEGEPAPEFARFLHAEDDHARAVLSHIPGRDRLLSAISDLDGLSTVVSMLTTANDKRFFLRLDAGTQLARLMMQDIQAQDAAGAATILVDPPDPAARQARAGSTSSRPRRTATWLPTASRRAARRACCTSSRRRRAGSGAT